jgi:peroxiredoxin Q/BCP
VRDALPDLATAGVAVVGISPDKVAQQKKFDDKHRLGFPLLSDTENRIA